ncbi:MAG: 50S ribosomal protein L13 [Patescibacteria group bacterium]|jgi:large subunit ribosomal protein L13
MLKRTVYTNTISAKDIKTQMVVIDAKDQVLGRLATKVAQILQGKHKTNYVANLVMGDLVIITNAKYVKVTGRKNEQKMYSSYSGYPGGLREENYATLQGRHPEEIVRRAISGMLPNNKLRDVNLNRMLIVAESKYAVPKAWLEIIEKKDATSKK